MFLVMLSDKYLDSHYPTCQGTGLESRFDSGIRRRGTSKCEQSQKADPAMCLHGRALAFCREVGRGGDQREAVMRF